MNTKLLSLAGICLSGAVSCTESPEKNVNIIVFIADDVSYNDFGCTGNTEVHTPNIDYIAGKGINFSHTFLTASSCSPSRISIMTGRYPHNTGAAELHSQPEVGFASLASELHDAGYYTLASGKWHMGKLLKSGFDTIQSSMDRVLNGGEGCWEEALRARPKDQPFFMWLASFDAHRNWGENDFSGNHDPDKIQPPPYLADMDSTKKDLASYYDEIHRFDYYIGKVHAILEEQGIMDNTLILIMADNGRAFPFSKTRVTDRGMRTPMIISWKNGISNTGKSSEALISSIDIAPTLLDVAGVEAPESFQGRSFLAVLKDPEQKFRKYIFAEHNWHDFEAHERMIRSSDFLYLRNFRPQFTNQGPADVVNSVSFLDLMQLKSDNELNSLQTDIFTAPRDSFELFNCNTDPQQFENIAGNPEYKDIRIEMDSLLRHWMDITGDNVPDNLTADRFDRRSGALLPGSKSNRDSIKGEMPGKARNAESINTDAGF